MEKKIILAYTGDMNTTVIIPWLKENQDCEIIAVCINVGQTADWKAIQKRAIVAGASVCHIADVKKEYVEEFIWPALKAGAVYEDKYLFGTSTARALLAKVLVEYARNEKATAIAHGASCKGNDQIRLDLGIKALAPELEIIVPWRIWKIKNRKDQMRYLTRKKIALPEKKKASYSVDSSLWHVSHEGLELENLSAEPQYKKILSITTAPERAPNKPEYVEIEFEKGIPIALNGKKMEGTALIAQLNKIGGANGIGITDLVENRITGTKSRGVYETPGGSILYYAHKELERVCLDRQTYNFKQQASFKMSKLIYGGKWFTPLREALSAFVDSTQKNINGKIKLKLLKGSISSAGVTSPNSLFLACANTEQEKNSRTKTVKASTKAPSVAPGEASAKTKTPAPKAMTTGKTAKKNKGA